MSRALLRDLDPRHSLVAGLIWLVVALAASFAVAASVWAGRVAREIVVQQHVRRLVLETDQLASDLGQAVSTRLAAIRAANGNARARLNSSNGLSPLIPIWDGFQSRMSRACCSRRTAACTREAAPAPARGFSRA